MSRSTSELWQLQPKGLPIERCAPLRGHEKRSATAELWVLAPRGRLPQPMAKHSQGLPPQPMSSSGQARPSQSMAMMGQAMPYQPMSMLGQAAPPQPMYMKAMMSQAMSPQAMAQGQPSPALWPQAMPPQPMSMLGQTMPLQPMAMPGQPSLATWTQALPFQQISPGPWLGQNPSPQPMAMLGQPMMPPQPEAKPCHAKLSQVGLQMGFKLKARRSAGRPPRLTKPTPCTPSASPGTPSDSKMVADSQQVSAVLVAGKFASKLRTKKAKKVLDRPKPACFQSVSTWGQASIAYKIHLLALAEPTSWNPATAVSCRTIEEMTAALAIGFGIMPESSHPARQQIGPYQKQLLQDYEKRGRLLTDRSLVDIVAAWQQQQQATSQSNDGGKAVSPLAIGSQMSSPATEASDRPGQ